MVERPLRRNWYRVKLRLVVTCVASFVSLHRTVHFTKWNFPDKPELEYLTTSHVHLCVICVTWSTTSLCRNRDHCCHNNALPTQEIRRSIDVGIIFLIFCDAYWQGWSRKPCLTLMQTMMNRTYSQLQPSTSIYIEEGYSIMRTEAPKERAGRGVENLARTTPELPNSQPKLVFITTICCSRSFD